MKFKYPILLGGISLVFMLLFCSSRNLTNKEVVLTFNESFNQRDNRLVKSTLSKRLKVTSHTGRVVATKRKEYFENAILIPQVFGTIWTILEIEEKGNII